MVKNTEECYLKFGYNFVGLKITDLLFQDREKERVKRESEEAKRREAEEAEAAVRSAQERQEKIRQAKIDLAARVQPEPDASDEDVTRILIKVHALCSLRVWSLRASTGFWKKNKGMSVSICLHFKGIFQS